MNSQSILFPDWLLTLRLAFQTFLHVLYRLAANPEFAEPMREEAERIVAEEGWSKTALNNMRRIDSFIRETQRLDGLQLSAYSNLRFPAQGAELSCIQTR